jgi:hypothetical protein
MPVIRADAKILVKQILVKHVLTSLGIPGAACHGHFDGVSRHALPHQRQQAASCYETR